MGRFMNPSAIESMENFINGIRVEVPAFANATYFLQAQWELFKIRGRILLTRLFCEMVTANSTGATLFQFNYTFTTPAITVKPLCAVSASIASLPQGSRIVWVGGAVATAAVITVATGGCSDVVNTNPVILGGLNFVGTLGMLTTTANAVGGTSMVVACYVPLSDGAYMEANALPTAP
jgi:hypothetical protein